MCCLRWSTRSHGGTISRSSENLLQEGYDATERVFQQFTQRNAKQNQEVALRVLNPEHDERSQTMKDEDMIYRKLLYRMPEWLRFPTLSPAHAALADVLLNGAEPHDQEGREV